MHSPSPHPLDSPPPKKKGLAIFRKLRKTSSCIDASFKGEAHLIVSLDLLGKNLRSKPNENILKMERCI